MRKDTEIESDGENKANIVIFTIIVGIAVFFGVKSLLEFRKDGVYTVAKVRKPEGAPSGADLYLTVFFQGKEIPAVADAICSHCVGKYFFVKVKKNKPTDVIFYYDKSVPHCIMEAPLPPEGWKEIPKCE